MSPRNRIENASMETLSLRVLPDIDNGSSLKVYVSFHKIAFSTKKADMNDGILVSDGVYFSPLVHLLYIYNVVGGENFEEAKELVRGVLRESIGARKSKLERSDSRSREVQLLERALLLL